MVNDCYVCKQEKSRGDGISFHLFPRDAIMREKWVNAVPKRKRRITHTAMVCSRHFRKEDYEMKQWKRVLKKDAVPSVQLIDKPRGYHLGEKPDPIYFGTLCIPPLEEENEQIGLSTPRLSKNYEAASPCTSDNDSEIQDVEYLEDSDSDSSSKYQNEVPPTNNIKENVTSNEIRSEDLSQAVARIDKITDELSKKKQDEFDGFGIYVATTLRSLPTKLAIEATKEIQNTLKDVQLKSAAYRRRRME